MERFKELEILIEIGSKVASTLDLDAILAYVMQKLKEVFEVEACSLMLLDEEEWVLRFRLSFGTGAEEAKALSFSADQGLAGWMVQQKKPVLVHDVQRDERFFQQIDHSTGLDTRDMIGTPLLVKGRVIGVVEAINKVTGAFTEEDLRLLGLIAGPIAQAIENARLFDALNVAYNDVLDHQKQIEESRNLLRTLFNGISDALLIVDRELNIVAGNVAAAAIMNVAAEDLVGQSCYQGFLGSAEVSSEHGPVRETFRTAKRAFRATKFVSEEETRQWEVHTYPLLDEGGEVVRVVVFGRDVTERRILQATVARSAKLAAVGKLAAGTAHELGNPLTTILGNAALLHKGAKRGSSEYMLSGAILEGAERARYVLRSLLDYSRQDQYKFVTLNLNATLEWAVSLLRYTFVEGEIELHRELDSALPPVIASESHLHTLWTNLLLNAVDAVKGTKRGSKGRRRGLIEMSSRLQENGKTVRIAVRDFGTGIAEDSLPRLFEPFFTTKKPGEGTGLGLYICHTVVEQHGGRIDVASEEGQGTEFAVMLPVGGPPGFR
ncbi:MAG TPA: ATP-binding protein [Anaerolineae bacterium]|nr:ATP-binding protein [Anaerolineae bacterium]